MCQRWPCLGPQRSCGLHLAETEGVASLEVGTQVGHRLAVRTATCENLGKRLASLGQSFLILKHERVS